jgi:hypothetical protein
MCIHLTQVRGAVEAMWGRPPAAGTLAGLPECGRGRPSQSRGTTPPSRCQSDYLSQVDSPFAQFAPASMRFHSG